MGLMDKLLGKDKEYPPLDADSPAAKRLDELRQPLESLVRDVSEPVEVVTTTEGSLYAFIGKPPKKFGLAWIHGDEVSNMKALVEQKNLSPIKMERLVDQLREAYQRSEDAPRYATSIADEQVVVTLSDDLGRDVHALIRQVAD